MSAVVHKSTREMMKAFIAGSCSVHDDAIANPFPKRTEPELYAEYERGRQDQMSRAHQPTQ